MKGSKFGNSRFLKRIRQNGVFIALTIGLIAIFTVGYFGISQDRDNVSEKSDEQPVEQLVTDQPDERTTTAATTTEKVTTTAKKDVKQLYVLPLTDVVQKPFSAEQPVYSITTKDWRLHLGVDFAGESGQSVKSTTKGTVKAIEEDKLWGSVITIDHGVGVISRYCGVSPSVKVGDKVETGAVIGKLADIPCESAQTAHLHMQMIVDNVPIDPVEAIGQQVRYAETEEE